MDLLLLYIHYVLKKEGWKVFYLGADVSLKNLQEVFPIKKPGYLLSYFSRKNSFSLEDCSSLMKEALPHSKLLIINTFPASLQEQNFENITAVNLEEALDYLSRQKNSVDAANESIS